MTNRIVLEVEGVDVESVHARCPRCDSPLQKRGDSNEWVCVMCPALDRQALENELATLRALPRPLLAQFSTMLTMNAGALRSHFKTDQHEQGARMVLALARLLYVVANEQR